MKFQVIFMDYDNAYYTILKSVTNHEVKFTVNNKDRAAHYECFIFCVSMVLKI